MSKHQQDLWISKAQWSFLRGSILWVPWHIVARREVSLSVVPGSGQPEVSVFWAPLDFCSCTLLFCLIFNLTVPVMNSNHQYELSMTTMSSFIELYINTYMLILYSCQFCLPQPQIPFTLISIAKLPFPTYPFPFPTYLSPTSRMAIWPTLD